MRRIHSRGLVAALEEEQVIEAAVAEASAEPAPAPEVLDNAESLETELLEVQDTVEEGAVQEAQVDDAAEVVEALDEYQEALESISKQGGLDRNGAMILQIGLEQLYARVGLEPKSVAMPSMESFGGTSSRVKSTKVAMEGIKEAGKELWAKIIAAIKRAGDWLKNFWKTLTDSNHRLKARADKVVAAAASLKGEAKGEIENAGLAAKLAINGVVGAQYSHDFAVFGEFVAGMATKVIPGVVGFAEHMTAKMKAGITSEGDIEFESSRLKQAYAGVKLSPAGGEAVEGLDTMKSDQLPGGKALVVQYPNEDGTAGAKAFAQARMSIGLYKPELAKVKSEKLPVLASTEIGGIAKTVKDVSAHIDSLRALEKNFDSFIKALYAGAEAYQRGADAAASAEDGKVGAVKAKYIVVRSLIMSMTQRISNLPATFGQYTLVTAKAAMDYCELSIKQYA